MRVLLSVFALSVMLLSQAEGEDALKQLLVSTEAVPQMIAVEMKLIEGSDEKFEKLGVEISTYNGQQSLKADGLMAFRHMSSAASIGFVEALVKNRVGRVMAEPRIAAISGRQAYLSVGSQSEAAEAVGGANERLGMELRMTPTLLSDNKVQVDLYLKYSWQEIEENSESDNQVRQFSLDTSLVSKSRESRLLSGLEFKNYSDSRFLLIVTPELIESIASTPQTATK